MLNLELRSREGALRCTYCRDDLPTEGVHACGLCGTILHAACARELSACPTIGCEEEITLGDALTSLSAAMAQAERILRAALQKGDSATRRLAWERYTAASQDYRDQARLQPLPPSPPAESPPPPPRSPWQFPEEARFFGFWGTVPCTLILGQRLPGWSAWAYLGLGLLLSFALVYLVCVVVSLTSRWLCATLAS